MTRIVTTGCLLSFLLFHTSVHGINEIPATDLGFEALSSDDDFHVSQASERSLSRSTPRVRRDVPKKPSPPVGNCPLNPLDSLKPKNAQEKEALKRLRELDEQHKWLELDSAFEEKLSEDPALKKRLDYYSPSGSSEKLIFLGSLFSSFVTYCFIHTLRPHTIPEGHTLMNVNMRSTVWKVVLGSLWAYDRIMYQRFCTSFENVRQAIVSELQIIAIEKFDFTPAQTGSYVQQVADARIVSCDNNRFQWIMNVVDFINYFNGAVTVGLWMIHLQHPTY